MMQRVILKLCRLYAYITTPKSDPAEPEYYAIYYFHKFYPGEASKLAQQYHLTFSD